MYLYCQNTSCGVYLGCSGGDECYICDWRAGRDMNESESEEEEELDED